MRAGDLGVNLDALGDSHRMQRPEFRAGRSGPLFPIYENNTSEVI